MTGTAVNNSVRIGTASMGVFIGEISTLLWNVRWLMLLAKAPGLLAELNPVYKEKQETEKRFSKIEDTIAEMKDMLSGFIKEFKS